MDLVRGRVRCVGRTGTGGFNLWVLSFACYAFFGLLGDTMPNSVHKDLEASSIS